MRSSKQLFQSSKDFKGYQEIIANPAFESACNAALMAMIEELPQKTTAPSESWDCHCQIVGARNVLEKLSQLHEKDDEMKIVRPDELKYGTSKHRP